jgi:hypothetical protein
MPDRRAEYPSESCESDTTRKLNDAAVDIAIGKLTLPNVHKILIRIRVMISVNEPEFVDNRCEFNVQGPLRFHVAEQNYSGRLKFSGCFDNVEKLAVRITAE